MASITWDADVAEVYDETYAAMFEPSVLGPVTGLLAELARRGTALEFASGTGRVALALSARGVPIRGLELSQPMAGQMAAPFTLVGASEQLTSGTSTASPASTSWPSPSLASHDGMQLEESRQEVVRLK